MCLLRVPGPPCPTCQLSVKRPGCLSPTTTVVSDSPGVRTPFSMAPTMPTAGVGSSSGIQIQPEQTKIHFLLHHRLFGDTVVPYSLSETFCISQQPGAWLYSRNLRAAQCISCYIYSLSFLCLIPLSLLSYCLGIAYLNEVQHKSFDRLLVF